MQLTAVDPRSGNLFINRMPGLRSAANDCWIESAVFAISASTCFRTKGIFRTSLKTNRFVLAYPPLNKLRYHRLTGCKAYQVRGNSSLPIPENKYSYNHCSVTTITMLARISCHGSRLLQESFTVTFKLSQYMWTTSYDTKKNRYLIAGERPNSRRT